MTYNHHFWDGAVKVEKEEIEIGDILILGDRWRPGGYTEVVEVCVMSLNPGDTATVVVRGGGVENVRLDNLKRPDWFKMPRYWSSGRVRTICHYRRPLHKDDMLKHGVAVTRVLTYDSDGDESDGSESDGIAIDYSDFMFEDYIKSKESGIRSRKN